MKHYILPKNTKTHVLLWDIEFHNVGSSRVGLELYGTPATLAITSRDYYFSESMVISFDNRLYCDFNKNYEYINKNSRGINIDNEKSYYRMFFYPEDCKQI